MSKKLYVAIIGSPADRLYIPTYPTEVDVVIMQNYQLSVSGRVTLMTGVTLWVTFYPGVLDKFRSQKEFLSSDPEAFPLKNYNLFASRGIKDVDEALKIIEGMFSEFELYIY